MTRTKQRGTAKGTAPGTGRLERLARRHGIATGYDHGPVPEATLEAILRALGVDPHAEPDGDAAPADVPVTARCHLPDWLERRPAWGVFCQLYELRSDRQWGIGDFADLAAMARTCGAAGADFLGINPVHALFTAEPKRCSPFSPSSRVALNPLYIAPDALGAERPAMADGDLVDHAEVARAKLGALREVFDAGPAEGFAAFEAEAGEDLTRHALFEAASHHLAPEHGATWGGWAEPWQDPASEEVRAFAAAHSADVRFHLWLQWIARVQLGEAQAAAKAAGMRLGLYLDLAVGEDPGGSATWGVAAGRGHTLPGVRVGAPPDIFAADGQGWGLVAPSPAALEATDYAPFRAMIEAQLKDAGALRIDHAMALRQLYLIPEGARPKDGAHLTYPMAALIGALAEASRAHEAVVIGEDLGWVPDGFRDEMNEARILSYRIVVFEQDEDGFHAPGAYPEIALGCLSTHDLPILSAWWAGEDIDLREAHGLVSPQDSVEHRAHRGWERRAILRALTEAGLMPRRAKAGERMPEGLAVALHRFLARTPCVLTAMRLADAVGPEVQTNVPGTTGAHPNWRPRARVRVDEIAAHPDFRALTGALAEERPRP